MISWILRSSPPPLPSRIYHFKNFVVDVSFVFGYAQKLFSMEIRRKIQKKNLHEKMSLYFDIHTKTISWPMRNLVRIYN